MRIQQQKRRGATTVEFASISAVTMLLVVGLIVGSFGIFRYQQMASLARKAARYASVHGTQYANDTGNPAATPQDIYNNAIAPDMVGLDPNNLTYSVTYNQSNHPYQGYVDASGQIVGTVNTVTVTVSYQWVPEAFLGGMTLSSTSTVPMSN
jgi:Flp pilus assembly protein TadG